MGELAYRPRTRQRQPRSPRHLSRIMYSVYDKQLRRLMLTGRNSPTKEAAKSDLLHYLSADHTTWELAELSKLTPDELAARCQYQVLKHLKPYPYDQEQLPL